MTRVPSYLQAGGNSLPAAAEPVTLTRMSSAGAARRKPLAIVVAIVASLVLAPSAWAGQSSVRAYGGAGGNVENQAGPPGTVTPPGGTVTPPPSVTPPPAVSPPPPGVKLPPTGPPPVYKTPVAPPSHSLLSLPRTGFTIAILIGAGLLLTGVGLVTRRVAGVVERST
jgi:hypothetical protein